MSSKPFRKEEVQGKTVIETSGKVGGKVKDLTFSLDGTITLIVAREDGTEVQVPLKQVIGISDHVVVRSDAPAIAPAARFSGAGGCKYCGAELPAGTTWCPACGRSQS